MNLLSGIWTEKYRPKTIDELILPDDYKSFFKQCIHKKDISNLLLVGPAGAGKTSLARILISKGNILSYPDENVLEVNGSAQSSRGISFVDEVVEPFLKLPPVGGDKFRVVFIDECDSLTDQSFKSQRAIIEKYSKYGRFIFTANYISKIPLPIQSRFQTFVFKQIPIDFVTSYCYRILDSECISYKKEDVSFIVSNLYPDIRKIINTLQKSCTDSKLSVPSVDLINKEKTLINYTLELLTALQNRDRTKINVLIDKVSKLSNDVEINFANVYSQLFNTEGLYPLIKVIVNKYANSHLNCLIPSMHYMAMIYESVKCVDEYMKLMK